MGRGVMSTTRLLRKAAQVYETTIGNGADVSFTLTPGFDTQDCIVEVSVASTGVVVAPKITKDFNGSTQVKVEFEAGDVPAANQYRVIIVGRLL